MCASSSAKDYSPEIAHLSLLMSDEIKARAVRLCNRDGCAGSFPGASGGFNTCSLVRQTSYYYCSLKIRGRALSLVIFSPFPFVLVLFCFFSPFDSIFVSFLFSCLLFWSNLLYFLLLFFFILFCFFLSSLLFSYPILLPFPQPLAFSLPFPHTPMG